MSNCDVGLQFITMKVSMINGSSFMLTTVYGSNDLVARRDLWSYLMNFAATNTLPWLVLGDYNAIMSAQEKVGGAGVTNYDTADLSNCVANSGLVDLRFTGNYLTWCNKRDNRTYTKIDRAMANSEWIAEFPDHEAEFTNPSTYSDHSAMLVCSKKQVDNKRKAFRFFNFWVEEPGYQEVVGNAWRTRVVGNPMYVLMAKLKQVKQDLIAWNKERLGNVTTR
ncbi:Dnase i-like superfamily protein, partial [Thalictrum thalictroides]